MVYQTLSSSSDTLFFHKACIYGDVTKIDTTGASEKTAKQDKLTVKGVAASHKLAEHDLANMNKYKPLIIKVGRAQQMDPCVIAGIISRESRAGTQLKDGWGDHGNGFGLMQHLDTLHRICIDYLTAFIDNQQQPCRSSVPSTGVLFAEHARQAPECSSHKLQSVREPQAPECLSATSSRVFECHKLQSV
ncbi:Lysozyme g [Acipenser ruthenus]|uniref:Lysozyme g n=1 Tax=Acipenser ruthenus TaxID=7906 RepID=A0A444V3A5_ACIRT|nr:Lysozyme g [Acipenser ruthenus]